MSNPAEQQERPVDFGGPDDWPFEPFPREAIERPAIERFWAIARRCADRLAVRDLEKSLTYGELADQVRRLAGAIRQGAGAREGPVAVLLPNDASFPTALLAAFAAGRGVVPLDADHPLERNRLIAANAEPALLVSAGRILADVGELFPAGPLALDIDAVAGPAAEVPANVGGPEDPAYIIYTSGSTGTPKGVFQNQRGLLHDIMQSVNALHISDQDRLGMFYSAAVVAGLRVSLGALLTGAELHMLPPRELGSAGLAREIRRRGVTMFRSSATLFSHVAEALGPGGRLESLRVAALGGDRIEWRHYDAFRRITAPNSRFASHLGATECSTLYAEWFVDEAFRRDGERLPVGWPLPERRVRLIGDDGREVPDGEVGEFAVSSRFIAQGYWKNPELTERAFRADPEDPLARVYRTGDLGRRRPDGLYEFMGRRDHQVSLRGARIELGEVEAALQACPGVRNGAVIVRRSVDGQPEGLAAYVQPQAGIKGLAPRHLAAMLQQRLPAHMIPAEVFILDELPWLPNFKIDRLALERLDMANLSSAGPITDPLLAKVASTFEDVLKVKGATGEDTLLSLGGDSLQAVDVVLELERRLGIAVPLETFQQSQSLQELTDRIAAVRAQA
jgi:amino acid adenylation domain-containing protein